MKRRLKGCQLREGGFQPMPLWYLDDGKGFYFINEKIKKLFPDKAGAIKNFTKTLKQISKFPFTHYYIFLDCTIVYKKVEGENWVKDMVIHKITLINERDWFEEKTI